VFVETPWMRTSRGPATYRKREATRMIRIRKFSTIDRNHSIFEAVEDDVALFDVGMTDDDRFDHAASGRRHSHSRPLRLVLTAPIDHAARSSVLAASVRECAFPLASVSPNTSERAQRWTLPARR
jgi:hypothetical protein